MASIQDETAGQAAGFDCTKQPWGIRGVIVHGHGRGGTMLGFPTANIDVTGCPPTTSVLPTAEEKGHPVASPTRTPCALQVEATLKEGINHVFFGWGVVESSAAEAKKAGDKDEIFPVVMSVGYNPHFKDVHALAIEAHYLHKFTSDFYGAIVRIAVLGDLRVMGAFTTLEALIEVIRKDCEDAKEKLANLEEWKQCAFLAASKTPVDGEPSKLPLLVTPLLL